MKLEDVLQRFDNVITNNEGQFTALCPAHDDNVNSLSISQNNDDNILLFCHAWCETKDIMSKLGLKMSDLFNPKQQPSVEERTVVAEYHYCDSNGVVLHKTIRYAPKSFAQARPNPANPNEWIHDLKGVNTVIYNLPAVEQVIMGGYPIFIVEGEKDCETLRSLGFTATTCPSGAGKWKDRYSDYLTGSYAYIIADNDATGKRHANKVAASLHGKASQIKILDLTKIVTTLHEKGDITDVVQFLGAQEAINRLLQLMNIAEPYNGTIMVNPDTFFDKNKFKHDLLAGYMLSNYSIARVKDRLSIYKDGLYTTKRDVFERIMIDIVPRLTKQHREEVYSYISKVCGKHLSESPANFIGLKDCVFDINTENLFAYSPYFVIPNRIQYNYNPNAYHKLLDETLNAYACGDPGIRALIEEMFGYCLYRRNELGGAFFLKGVGKNGKSTIIALLALLIGDLNYSSLEFKDLNKQFINVTIVDKLANLGDDISAEYISDTSIFKKLATGNPITMRPLYEPPFEYKNYAKLIFSCNEMPTVGDKSKGFNRRLIIIPLNAQFDATSPNFDPYFIDKISTPEAMEYLLLLAIQGLKRILVNKAFTNCAAVVNETQAYVNFNNPLLTFINEMGNISTHTTAEVYSLYCNWAGQNGLIPMNNILFGREIKKHGYASDPNHKDESGKSVRRYVKEKDTDYTDGTDNLCR